MPSLALAAALSALAPAFAAGSLGAELTVDVGRGQSVAILPGDKGLLAVSADGSRQRQLTGGPVQAVLVDDRASVVWFERAGALWMLDLEVAAAQPERVAHNFGDRMVSVVYGASDQLRHRSSAYDGALELLLTASPPAFRYDAGLYDMIFEEQGERNAKSAEGVRWDGGMPQRLLAIAARGVRRPLLVPAVAAEQSLPQVPSGACEEPDLCGKAQPIGATRFLYVTVAHQCGDACHVRRQLYDTRTREFFDPRNPKRRDSKPVATGGFGDLNSTDDLWVAPRGEGFVSNGVLYDFERGRVSPSAQPVRGGGWIGSQWYVE